jgi:hypothetical protein
MVASPYAKSIRPMPFRQPSLSSGIMSSQQMQPRGGAYFLPNLNPVTPRGGYREPQNLTTDYTSVLEPIKGIYSDRLDEIASAPIESKLKYDPTTIYTDSSGGKMAYAVDINGNVDKTNSLNVGAADKRRQDNYQKRLDAYNAQKESLGENFTYGQLENYKADQKLQGMKDKYSNIDQGFFDSPEFEHFKRSGSGMGTSDVRFSPYFGQQGSGSIGGRQDEIYESYLNRVGNTGYLEGGQNFVANEGYGVKPDMSVSLTNRPQPSFTRPLGNPSFADASGGQGIMGRPIRRPNPSLTANFAMIKPNFNQSAFDDFMGGLTPDQKNLINSYGYNQKYQENQRYFNSGFQPNMGMGIGSQRPTGMGMFGGFPQRPPQRPQGIMGGFGMFRPQQPMNYSGYGMQQPMNYSGYGGMQRPQPMMNYSGYGMQRPQQNYGMQQPMNYSGYGQQPMQSPYQQYGMQGGGYQQSPYQQPYPQPQQYGGYGMSQGYGGQSSFAPMSNPYQPQQYGNSNNFSGYGMQPAQQFY